MNGAKSAYAVRKLYDLIFCVFRIVIVSLECCLGVVIEILTMDNAFFFLECIWGYATHQYEYVANWAAHCTSEGSDGL